MTAKTVNAMSANELMLRQLIGCLSDGEIHSGESLGQQLGVSRAAIWKQVQQLEQMGMHLEAHKGLGYQLTAPLDLLDAEVIVGLLDLPDQDMYPEVDVLFSTPSTNDQAIAQLKQNRKTPFVVLAESQTAGRGRRGRSWFSPLGGSIYMTLGWQSDRGLSGLEGLSLVVGLKLVELLEKDFGLSGLSLKWPNDVLWNRQKLAGVLVEVQGDPLGESRVAIGIGLNHCVQASTSGAASSAIDQPWVDLATVTKALDLDLPRRNKLAAGLLSTLIPALSKLETAGFAAFQEEWQRYDDYAGAEVMLLAGSDRIIGTAGGVNTQGGYEVVTEFGTQTVSGGELSLRLR